MSTRSRIGMETPNGAVYSIYCHWDGYPSHNGRLLVDHYRDEGKIRELIDLGSLSVLDENIGEQIAFDDRDARDANKQVVAYHRDRGEPLDIDIDDTVELFYARAADGWEQYVYLWKDGEWWVSGVGGGAGPGLVSRRDPNGELPPNWQRVVDVLQDAKADA